METHGHGPDDEERRPSLRIGGYVPGHAEPVAEPEPAGEPRPAPRAPEPAPQPVLPPALPNISDYWPDAPHRHPRMIHAGPPRVALDGPPEGRHRRPATVAVLLAALVAIGTLLLARPLTSSDRRTVAAPATTAVPAGVEPTATADPATSETPPPPPLPPPPVTTPPTTTAPTATTAPAPATARFELVSGVTELSVRTADLDGDEFRVTTPKDSGLDVDASFDDATLRVSAEPDGSESGNGRVDVLLSDDIVWRVRMGAGVHTASFDMGGGTVSDIDLIGGAHTVDIELGRLDGTLPILMAGGVHTWRISTSDEVPVRIAFGGGAGGVTLYGDDKGGVGGGTTLREGDLDDRPGLDIDAEAGIGSLHVDRD